MIVLCIPVPQCNVVSYYLCPLKWLHAICRPIVCDKIIPIFIAVGLQSPEFYGENCLNGFNDIKLGFVLLI